MDLLVYMRQMTLHCIALGVSWEPLDYKPKLCYHISRKQTLLVCKSIEDFISGCFEGFRSEHLHNLAYLSIYFFHFKLIEPAYIQIDS